MDEDEWATDSDYLDYEDAPEDLFNEVLELCLLPVLSQSVVRLLPVFGITFVVGEILYYVSNPKAASVISTLSGILLLATFVDQREALVSLFVVAVTYGWIQVSAKYRFRLSYISFLVMALMYLVFREHVAHFGSQSWTEVRGIAMISMMKTISLIYELSTKELQEAPTAVEYFGYNLFPGTLPFGPWINYVEHLSRLDHNGWDRDYFKWLVLISWKLICTFTYLLMGTCFFTLVFQYMEVQSSYGRLFLDALLVRFSHYFICQLSEAVLLLSGPRTPQSATISVSSPAIIEFPRSLVDAVVHWNIPMHQWLKKHIYKPLRLGGMSNAKAGVLTFLISAMLHGFSLRLTAVLLSLGIYCYVEYSFRETLSTWTNSCVRARPCNQCQHKFRHHLLVQLVNFGWVLLTMFNLAYLGALLEDGETLSTLERWREVGYSSHFVMLCFFVTTFFIRIL